MTLTRQFIFHKTNVFSVMRFLLRCLQRMFMSQKGEGGDIRDDDGDDLIFSSVSLESLYMLSLSHKPQKFLKSISDFVQF